jgi:N-methylhydantoinase A
MTVPGEHIVGVDIGGTFTDAVVIAPDGAVTVGKVSTTPEDFSVGFFGAIAAAAAAMGLPERELLASTVKLAHGTTVGINALVTGGVAKVALLATKGHGDTIRAQAGGGRIRGASIEELLDYRLSSYPAPVVPREQVFEISERLDRDGDVVVELSDDELDAAVERFAVDGIEAVAVAFLWSFVNPVHEQQAAARIRERRPDLFVSCSHQIAPRIGEYARTVATVMNAQIGPLMLGYIDGIVQGARERGFTGEVLFGQCEGGLVPADQAAGFPLVTLQSGPVAGVVGSALTGRRMDHPNIIVTDMGGTTLDVSTVEQGRVIFREENEVVRQLVYLRKVDVESVGAGGGSIAWIHEDSASLRVGPHSAGAVPGPICYGRGGTEVTVTDADLVLGILDPDRPLAGGLRLDRDAAHAAVAALGERLGLGVQECAAGIVEIVDSRMEDLIRRVTIQRGHDPRSFTLWAFGGASGAHAGLYGRGIGVEEVVFPLNNTASVWSAYGLALLDHARSFQANANLHSPFDLGQLARVLGRLEGEALTYAREHGLTDVELERRAGMKYPLQVYEVETELPPGEVDEKWGDALLATFHQTYEARFGAGTGYAEAGAALTAVRVTVRSPARVVPVQELAVRTGAPVAADSARAVYWRELGGPVETPIHRGAGLAPGDRITGPAVVEYPHTTIAVRPQQSLRVDGFGNLVLRLVEPPSGGPA